MAVTKNSSKSQSTHNALQALTAAALVLPGLLHSSAQAAEEDEFSFQYGRYQEGSRNLGDTKLSYDPITVDSLQSGGKIKLTDRIKLAFNFSQDTWAGATPITTAPVARYGNNPVTQSGTVVGASPYIQTIPISFSDGVGGSVEVDTMYFDDKLRPVKLGYDQDNGQLKNLGPDTRLVHTMVSASPEVRKEGSFKLGYEWDEAAATIGGGISSERDYESRFTNLGLRLDFDQKRTTLDIGASYTNSFSHALIIHDTAGFLSDNGFKSQIRSASGVGTFVEGVKEDWAGSLNLTKIINKEAIAKVGVGFTHSAGYMENPYKAVTAIFIQPNDGTVVDFLDGAPYVGKTFAYMEDRPNNRNQLSLNAGWVQYVEPLDAALHFDYKYFFDDWGINAHTFESNWVQPLGAGWTVTPRVRFYSQSAANFYYPYLVSFGADIPDASVGYNRLPTKEFSSDHRLSAYGTLSGGVMLSKQLAKGIRLDAGFEYYTHKGSLNMGSGGEGDYANFNYYLVSGALNVNISQLGRSLTESDHAHHHHMHHHGAPLPAGVMFGHMLPMADDVMVGYRYMYGRQDGDMLHGANKSLGDADIVAGGCLPETCRTAPTYMDMHMHMLDIMYAPTDWLNLMLMPQFMDMNMNMRGLSGVSPVADISSTDDHLTHGGHTTGGIADTSAYALFKLFGEKNHHVNLALGISAPTGDSGIPLNHWHKIDGGYIHYGMQTGSGTWDFKPSLTYTGHHDDWGWGAQLTGTTRLESSNKYGYALGDILQTSAWGSYNVLNWLSASVRGVYTTQGKVRGRFNALPGKCADNHSMAEPLVCDDVNPKHGVMDNPGNYGGQYWDVGLGLNASVMDGPYAGHQFGVEWLQPVMENVNGYQLERFGTLNATWTYMF